MTEIVTSIHASDCALHNAPALESGLCDCGAGGWQPIETAPRDGTPVLIMVPLLSNEPLIGCWNKVFCEWQDQWNDALDEGGNEVPTHWQPLPEPPETA